MKRLMIMVLVLGLTAGAASAQTAGSTPTRTTSVNSTGTYKAKKARKAKKAPSEVLNNRRIYHWQNGQRATPTGHEAAPTGGGYQSLKRGDAANRQRNDKKTPGY